MGRNGFHCSVSEKAPPPSRWKRTNPGKIVVANRWSALKEFERTCTQMDFHIDERAAVLLDLDKTTLGARGRNDKVIDQVRIEAANQTIRALLGDEFDEQDFSKAYQRLNQPEFHPFTADNQDYLVYICMILGSGLTSLETLVADVQHGKWLPSTSFSRLAKIIRRILPPTCAGCMMMSLDWSPKVIQHHLKDFDERSSSRPLPHGAIG